MFDIKKEQIENEYRYTVAIDLGFETVSETRDNLASAVYSLSSTIENMLWCYFNNFSTIQRTYIPVDLPRLRNYIEGVGNKKFHPYSDILFTFRNPFGDNLVLSLYTDGIDKIMDEFSVNHELVAVSKTMGSINKVLLEAEYRLDAAKEEESPYRTLIAWGGYDHAITVFSDNTYDLRSRLNERLCMLLLEEIGEKYL